VPHSARVATLSLAELLVARERNNERKTNLTAMLKALLDDVVAKHVLHEGYGMRFHHLKHCHYLLWWGVCQLLLYKATAVLIPAEVMHITVTVKLARWPPKTARFLISGYCESENASVVEQDCIPAA